jgi:hypothetical protein
VTVGDARDFKHENGRDYERCWVRTGDDHHWWIGYWGWVELPAYEVWQGLNEGEP